MVDSACDGIAEPHDGAEEKDGKNKLQCGDHESTPVISLYGQRIKRAINST
jgi:hypothetical protein